MFLKFVSPGMAGVPDRLLLSPGGRITFCEMKDIGETLKPLQERFIRKLKALGFDARCVDSPIMVDSVVEEIFGTQGRS